MIPTSQRTLLALLVVTACGPVMPHIGVAQISEWQQRVAPEVKGTPKAVPQKALPGPSVKPRVKSETVETGRAPSAPLPGATKGTRSTLGPTTAPNGSTHVKGAEAIAEAAFEAFEQGKYLTALELAERAASLGDPQAHTLLGRIHAEGLGVGQDFAKAARWYGEGVQLGDLESAFALGVLHAQGNGVAKNFDEAARLFEMAALKGHPQANYNLALLFLKGQGKTENPVRAYRHMLFAAERSVPEAQYDVGTLYMTGTGTEPNAFEGAKWIGRAARTGHPEAEIEYAIILFKVDADPNDKEQVARQLAAQIDGFKLLRKSAERGNPIGQNRLARCYANGVGSEMNLVEAAKWNFIAREGGIEDAALDKLLARLSKADRDKAQRAAEEWRERSVIQ